MSLLELQNGSDVRGVALSGVEGEDINLTTNAVRRIAFAYKEWISKKLDKDNVVIAVGRDSRISGEMLVEATVEGLSGDNVTIYDCNMASTPAMFMTTIDRAINADGAIMITASHLPFNRNGMKFFTKKGGAQSKDIREILTIADHTPDINPSNNTKTIEVDFISTYAQGLVEFIQSETKEQEPFKGKRIIVDAGNGAGGFFAEKVLIPLGADTLGSIYLEPNGYFPNHEPNPENEEAMNCIVNRVKETNASLGIIFDTDVDRAAVVDGATGKPINRNALVALMSAIVLDKHPGTTIVTDSVTSKGLTDFIKSLGGVHHRYKRGYKNVINESMRLNDEGIESPLAIETSGHCAFKENYFLDDGAYLVTKILILFANIMKDGTNLGDLISKLKDPVEINEIRVKINSEDFKGYGEEVLNQFKEYVTEIKGWELEVPNYEGVRVNCKDEEGWLLIRISLHDPVMAINIESDKIGGSEEIKNKILSFLLDFQSLEL